jgi:hypothetical protein
MSRTACRSVYPGHIQAYRNRENKRSTSLTRLTVFARYMWLTRRLEKQIAFSVFLRRHACASLRCAGMAGAAGLDLSNGHINLSLFPSPSERHKKRASSTLMLEALGVVSKTGISRRDYYTTRPPCMARPLGSYSY